MFAPGVLPEDSPRRGSGGHEAMAQLAAQLQEAELATNKASEAESRQEPNRMMSSPLKGLPA